MTHRMDTLKVLRAFLDDPGGDHYGLGLIADSGVKAGSLYPILRRLELDGWVTDEWEDIDESEAGRRKRRYYRLSGNGEAAARAALSDAVRSLTPPPSTRRLWAPS